MREKQLRCVITFPTTAAAMAMERACEKKGLAGRIISVPRSITAGCGICWAAPPQAREELEDMVMEEKIQISGIYMILI